MNLRFYRILMIVLAFVSSVFWFINEDFSYELPLFWLSIGVVLLVMFIYLRTDKDENEKLDDAKKSMLWNIVTIGLIVTLLNVDHVLITNPGYLLAFRISYIFFFLMDFIISIFNRKQSGFIGKIFEPLVSRYHEFPEHLQKFIVIGLLVGMIIILSAFSAVMLYF